MDVVELKVELLDMPYPVTRVLRVPVAATLADLHRLLQAAMPWEDGHLHEFTLGRDLRWAKQGSGADGARSTARTTLAEVVALTGRRKGFLYTYDMGDSWEHAITPGKPRALAAGEAAVALLAAQGRCPPEDSGGAPGFDRMLQVAGDPSDDEHEDIVDWLGDAHPWNPAADMPALVAGVRKDGDRIVRRLAKGG